MLGMDKCPGLNTNGFTTTDLDPRGTEIISERREQQTGTNCLYDLLGTRERESERARERESERERERECRRSEEINLKLKNSLTRELITATFCE